MGFRSTFTTQHYPIKWPLWFVKKWEKYCWFNEKFSTVFSAKFEAKTYIEWLDIQSDIQNAIDWNDFEPNSFIIVFLHECGGITRCQIEKNRIFWSEPESWMVTECVEHDYCYGCSDVPNVEVRGGTLL